MWSQRCPYYGGSTVLQILHERTIHRETFTGQAVVVKGGGIRRRNLILKSCDFTILLPFQDPQEKEKGTPSKRCRLGTLKRPVNDPASEPSASKRSAPNEEDDTITFVLPSETL